MFEVFWIIFLLLIQVILLAMFVLCVSMAWQAIFHVPWVRTPKTKSRTMFDLAGLQEGECVLDLGSGDGSIVLDAVRERGANGIGIEGRRDLLLLSKWRARKVREKAQFFRGNFFNMELPNADVICSYLLTEVNAKLEPILIARYPSGTRVVSRVFPFPTLPLEKTIEAHGDTFRLYRIP